MKECFKKWVLTHDKLYKLIVFVIALVAFLAVTAHGCKTMEAEAAEQKMLYIDGMEIDVSDFPVVEDKLATCLCVAKRDYGNGIARYEILSYLGDWSGKISYEGFGLNVSNGVATSFEYVANVEYSVYTLCTKSASELGVSGSWGIMDMPYIQKISEPFYLVNAPYFSHVSTEVQNPILLKNAALNRMYTEIQFKLMGQPMTPSGGYEAEFFVDVYLPSIDLLHDMVYLYVYETNTSTTIKGSTYSEFQYKLNESYQNWWLNVSRGKESYKKFTLRFTQTYEHPIDGNVLLNLPHDYLLECIETAYGSVEDMYLGGIASDKHIYEFCYPTLLKFMTVGQVGNIVHTYNYPDIYYGRYTTITYKANLTEPVITEYNDDYFAAGGSDSVDKAVQEEINNAYNDIADKLQSDNQALQDMLDAYYRGENAFSDYNSSDVWSFLSDTTKGLVSVLPSMSGLAAVVGVVFGFLPIQISGMIMTLFVICIFTAIIRFIRG